MCVVLRRGHSASKNFFELPRLGYELGFKELLLLRFPDWGVSIPSV